MTASRADVGARDGEMSEPLEGKGCVAGCSIEAESVPTSQSWSTLLKLATGLSGEVAA